ncbi:ABC transporter ATP-binding protein [Caldimicrobium thiodismutans]|uniref:ABC transporter ATP-binding protein n=1 Tax=Caldimicrobium thiodismutans TaxID=1653476 RepID=A0A0U4W1E6_9BACT|nr:ABC transporter ATP-binding protein [Caldimicrobium thiodismutans]BAU22971.1 ABC transporter ATP-binding protein [Caldimicrobium thiodismutans]
MLLRAHQIKKGFSNGKKRIEVLKGINFEVNKGEKIAILGPSGSGKTTLLNILGTLERPDSGEVFWEEKVLNFRDERELSFIRRKKMGFVFQFYHLMPELNVLENIMLPGLMEGLPRKEAQKRGEELLKRLKLSEKAWQRIYTLSGGERQKVAIARAIFLSPKILFADEPTGNLDAESAKEVVQLFLELNQELSLTLVVVTHNLEIAKKMDRIYLLKEGFLVEYSETSLRESGD